MNCFINQLLFFGLMNNGTLVPNTRSRCDSMDTCVNDMCQLTHKDGVDMVCFVSHGDYIATSGFIKPLLLSTSIILFIYSLVITGIFIHYYKNKDTSRHKLYEEI